uniref:Uncharacterized protein n=1 Tax=Scytonema sp. PCC 10023 TaxID=1680591 RepID=A0A0K0PDB5_9CYAN|nr:hypothetical protein [Scytonema sp. PCC 10023]
MFYQDEDFATLYPQQGQPAQAPGAFGDGVGNAVFRKSV